MRKLPKIGDTVFLEPWGNAARYSNGLFKAKVVSIGRKYIKVHKNGYSENIIENVDKDEFRSVSKGDCNSGYYMWLSIDEYNADKRMEAQLADIREYFRQYGKLSIDAETVQDIHDLLFPKE